MHQSMWCHRMGRMGRPWGVWCRKNIAYESPIWGMVGCQNPHIIPGPCLLMLQNSMSECSSVNDDILTCSGVEKCFHQNPQGSHSFPPWRITLTLHVMDKVVIHTTNNTNIIKYMWYYLIAQYYNMTPN